MNSNSKLTMIGGTIVGVILLLLIFGQWNNTPLPVSDDSVIQTVTEEVSGANMPTEPVEPDNSPSISNNVIQETATAPATEQQTTETDSPAVSTISGASSSSDGTDAVIQQTAPSCSTTIIYASGGHGHGSSHSSTSSNNANNEADQSASGDGAGSNHTEQSDSEADQGASGDSGVSDNPTEDQDDGTSDDESFFVLPESPVGSVLILASSLAAMGGFLAFRSRRIV